MSFVEDDTCYIYQDYKYGSAKNSRNLMDVVLPKENQKPGLILYIHGGGWITGDKTFDLKDAKEKYTAKGYSFAAINYRYASRKNPKVNCDDILDDISLAISNIKEIGLKHDINLEKSFLYGGSAGAHLSLQYSYTRREESAIPPVACCSLSGPTDLLDEGYYIGKNSSGQTNMIGHLISHKLTNDNKSEYQNLLEEYSPLYHLSSKDDAVPTIIAHGELDDVVPLNNAINLDNKLTELEVEHVFYRFPHSGHGLESELDNEIRNQVFDKMSEYVDTYLY